MQVSLCATRLGGGKMTGREQIKFPPEDIIMGNPGGREEDREK